MPNTAKSKATPSRASTTKDAEKKDTSTRNASTRTKDESKDESAEDATAMLRADHKLVASLFADYEKARTPAIKKELVSRICSEISVHAQIEEEIFYPAVVEALKDKQLISEALVEHASLKSLIEQVEGIDPDGDMYDARVMVLSEYVQHHVNEEEHEIFPKAKASKLDMVQLGAQLAERKAELTEAELATQ